MYHVTDISYGDARFFSVVDDNSASDKCITIARLASPRAATIGSSKNYKMSYACAMATRVNVVDVNLASGKCVVPSRSVSPSSLVSDYYKTPELCWFAFLNCSEKITDNYDYSGPLPECKYEQWVHLCYIERMLRSSSGKPSSFLHLSLFGSKSGNRRRFGCSHFPATAKRFHACAEDGQGSHGG
ncbi:rust resistance kinase Lr10-like isoform X1 [Iris pallida]|uniref:Rust resistance kinase Lr10-like isoform X1 n=1 Tax=Iris pallida TaxID=29817 RepID=A0AAX6F5B4_IRIPA|nr:rust resistance kinase Lr10-like isoform X1 [Iris pallida]